MKEALKLAAVMAVVVGAAIGFVALREGKGYALRAGMPVPDFRLRPLGGGSPAELSALRGKVVVLNFWATWCPPCVEEMPSLERLHRALGSEGLSVVGVAVDESDEDVRALVQRLAITFPTLRDPGGPLARSYRTTGYPETFVLDRQGKLVWHMVGPVLWDDPRALAYFRALLRGEEADPPLP